MKKLGIIMLDTTFERIVGDVGNEESFDYPIIKKVVKGADPKRVVLKGDRNLLKPFIQAAKELELEGATAITTSCGFLAIFQKEIADAVDIPVIASSLLQCKMIEGMLKKNEIIGVLTANGKSLSNKHFKGVGIEEVSKVVYGMEDTGFGKMFVEQSVAVNKVEAEKAMVEVARKMVNENPNIGAVVLECTNMPPYSKSIEAAIQRPVFDILTLCNFVMK